MVNSSSQDRVNAGETIKLSALRERATAGEALERLESDAFDFVLTDLSMPGLDGAQLLARVRQRWPQLPAAIMTGNPEKLKNSRAETGPLRVIQKPLSLTDLANVLSLAH